MHKITPALKGRGYLVHFLMRFPDAFLGAFPRRVLYSSTYRSKHQPMTNLTG